MLIEGSITLAGFPVSTADLRDCWIKCKFGVSRQLDHFVFAGFAWALRNNRNKMGIEHTFPSNPVDVIFTGVALLQKRCLLLNSKDQEFKTSW